MLWPASTPAASHSRAMASFEDESSPWARAFAADVAGLRSEGVTYADSAAFLRALVRKGSLRFTDVRDRPRRFFLAHRLLALRTFTKGHPGRDHSHDQSRQPSDQQAVDVQLCQPLTHVS